MIKKQLIIPVIILFIVLVVLFRPIMPFTFNKSVSENRILFQYEIVGYGSVVGKVLDGGEEITAKYQEEYPQIGIDEVVFTKDSDEPLKHMDIGEPIGEEVYVIEGEAVGVTRGAPDCCDPAPVYNEKVVEFKVDKWYTTEYIPFILFGDFGVSVIAILAGIIALVWIVISIIIMIVYKIIKKKRNIEN